MSTVPPAPAPAAPAVPPALVVAPLRPPAPPAADALEAPAVAGLPAPFKTRVVPLAAGISHIGRRPAMVVLPAPLPPPLPALPPALAAPSVTTSELPGTTLSCAPIADTPEPPPPPPPTLVLAPATPPPAPPLPAPQPSSDMVTTPLGTAHVQGPLVDVASVTPSVLTPVPRMNSTTC